MLYAAFDLEIANDFPPDGQPMEYGQLGISCAATAARDSDGQITYQTWTAKGEAMTESEARTLVTELRTMEQEGYTLVTVNGAGFDFRVLAAESGLKDACAEMALRHVDLCFMMLARRGYPLGLDAMAKGAGVEGKLHKVQLSDGRILEDMSGELAPKLWRDGEREAVIVYLTDDARATLETVEVVAKKRGIGWTARSGRRNWQPFAAPLSVKECLDFPLPDTSWMMRPLTRERVLSWAGNLSTDV